MAKLYAPTIDGALPAGFLTEFSGTNPYKILYLRIPYKLNLNVSLEQISRFAIKIKALSGNIVVEEEPISGEYTIENSTFIVTLDGSVIKQINNLNLFQSYYVQIACINKSNNEIGYWSNQGTTKLVKEPEITISMNGNFIKSTVECIDDHLYDIQFFVSEDNTFNNLIAQSKIILNSVLNDSLVQGETNKIKSTVEWQPNNLVPNREYYVKVFIRTVANAQLYSDTANITYNPYNDTAAAEAITNNFIINRENGINQIKFKLNVNNSRLVKILKQKTLNVGLQEEESDINSRYWYYLADKKLLQPNQIISIIDYDIEDGEQYYYGIQTATINSSTGQISTPSKPLWYKNNDSNYIKPFINDFEYCYLVDENYRQLAIKLDNKLSNFSYNIQENKIDTLGGRFPILFRNGDIEYRSFQLSGTISYQMDEEFYLGVRLTANQMRESTNTSVQLPSLNEFYNERKYREEVVKWLNNGCIKLFKSPTEGNMLVRLTNVSISPKEELGRMIYNFSANVYEVEEYNEENLEKYNYFCKIEIE